MSTPESEKRTSPRKSNTTIHFTPNTNVAVGSGGRGGCGGRGGHGGRGGGPQGGVHQGLGVEDLPPTPPLGYITVSREEWTIMSNKVQWLQDRTKEQAITIEKLEMKLADSPFKRVRCMKDQFFYSIEKNLKFLLLRKLFPVCKFLPDGWDIFSEEKGTICAHAMSLIVKTPDGFIRSAYWKEMVAPYINDTFVNHRCNLNQRVKTQFQSECMRCL